MATVVLWAIVWLLLINVVTYAAFAYDKRAAERGDWRVSEDNLLMMAFAGGSVGALLARRRLRHKTRKQPFSAALHLIVGLHLLFVAALAYAGVRGTLTETVASILG
jgi:uncharacterized membrane protein YsdA (DUF1294 family)